MRAATEVGTAASVVVDLVPSGRHLRLLGELLRHALTAHGLTVLAPSHPTGRRDGAAWDGAPRGPRVRAALVAAGSGDDGWRWPTGRGAPVLVISPCRDRRLLGARAPEDDRPVRFVSLQVVRGAEDLAGHITEAALDPAWCRDPLEHRLPLTDEQLEVAQLVARGHGNRTIAAVRHTSESAVRNMVSRILDRLGLPDDGGKNVRVLLARAIAEAEGQAPPGARRPQVSRRDPAA